MLLGGLNICFVVSDLISLYVALELVGIVAFLLILRDGGPQQLWIGLRYLLISNTAMTLYLVGLHGLRHHRKFPLLLLSGLPMGAAQVLLLELFTKGGLFLPASGCPEAMPKRLPMCQPSLGCGDRGWLPCCDWPPLSLHCCHWSLDPSAAQSWRAAGSR